MAHPNSNTWYNRAFTNTRRFTSDFTYGVGIAAQYIRYPVHKLRKGVDTVDRYIQHGSKIPIANDILSLLTDNPAYIEGLGFIHSVDKTFDDINKLAFDISDEIDVPRYTSGTSSTFRYSSSPTYNAVAFDQGFVSARKDIAAARGEKQIEGAYNYSDSFKRDNPQGTESTPAEVSGHNRGYENIGGGHIPAGQSPIDTIHYGEPTIGPIGSIDTGYASGFERPAPATTEITPQVPPGYEPYLPGRTPVQTAPPQTTA